MSPTVPKQTRRLGELHHAIASGVMGADTEVTELGQIMRRRQTRPRAER